MSIKISHNEVNSYVGDVFPLKLIADRSLENENITWSVSGEAVGLRSFENDIELPFRDAVMVSLKQIGEATVTASYDGNSYDCKIKVRERVHYSSDDNHNYYRGDLHTHTSRMHNHEEFINRTEGFQTDMVNFIKNENLLDFGVISDHSSVMGYGREFMRAYLTEEAARPMGPIMFPGAESENTVLEENRFGFQYKNAGELVVINADNHVNAFSWDEFLAAFETSVDPVLIFAHPQADSAKYGNWNFKFEKICRYPKLVKMAKCIEMGNGIPIKANLLHEYAFSRALDAGFRITTSCGSDGHGIWGYKICPGKTIIMTPERTREAFLDALLSNRAYACESANVKVRYTVNGCTAPCDLELTDTYKFNVSLDYFEDDETTRIVKCQVVSDNGEWVKEINGISGNSFEFEIKSTTARYFYIRMQDSEGRRTWSVPVWCSRPFDEYKENLDIVPLCQKNFTAYDEAAGVDADKTLHGDHIIPYESPVKNASIVIDMKNINSVSALGYATPRMPRTSPSNHSECLINHARYPRKIRISTSVDGVNYEAAYVGGIRTYSGEEIFKFATRDARYVKFEVITTVGDEYGRKEFMIPHVLIGILSLFTDK